jgi:RHS repeat-associated protein
MTEMGVDSGQLAPQRNYAYAGGALIATYDPGGQLLFRFTDWLGTLRATADCAGNLAGTCAGLPYGASFCLATQPDTHHFTGKERDAESGNDYFGARYYASSMGRFLSPDWSAQQDPVPYANLGYPQTLNLYSYAGNNPLVRTDPDGHFWQEFKNCLKWGVCVKDSQVETALQKQADEDRQQIANMENFSINGKSPADAIKGLSNKEVVKLNRAVNSFLNAQVDKSFLPGSGNSKIAIAMAIPVGITAGFAAGTFDAYAEAVAESRASAWIIQTGQSALATDIRTNITAQEFGANLEASGFERSVAKDGVTTLYSKGNQTYSIYQDASFGGTSANLNIGGKIVTKIRLE